MNAEISNNEELAAYLESLPAEAHREKVSAKVIVTILAAFLILANAVNSTHQVNCAELALKDASLRQKQPWGYTQGRDMTLVETVARGEVVTSVLAPFLMAAGFALLLLELNAFLSIAAGASLAIFPISGMLYFGSDILMALRTAPITAAAFPTIGYVGYRVIRRRIAHGGRPLSSRSLGWVIHIISGLVLAGACLIVYSRPISFELLIWATAGSVGLWRWGVSLRRPSAVAKLRKDPRPPVLYLRSFGKDSLQEVRVNRFRRVSLEVELTQALERKGPVIAIGRPGDVMARKGAARFFVANDFWKASVVRSMDRAAWVVMFVGATAGVEWELATSINRLHPERLLIYVPSQTRLSHRLGSYEAFVQKFGSLFAKGLPTHPGLATFIAFGPDWEPRLVPNGGKLSGTGATFASAGPDEALAELMGENASERTA